GAIAAGDYLKEEYGARIAAAEALECPTLLYNGFGEHNIQGIGDKHVPLIHNAMNSDFIVDISDRATDNLTALFNTEVGQAYLRDEMGVAEAIIEALPSFGYSSICNMLAAIKVSKQQQLGPKDVLATVATDGFELYSSELEPIIARDHGGDFDRAAAASVAASYLTGASTSDMLECTHEDRLRMFNLGYYTWVEQQGVSIEEFSVRRSQDFWVEMREIVHRWDDMIEEFNAAVAA
ncbi:MAG: pyridoxal-5'-phosphate-dependent protein subunit beta, partial [Chloroflexota bacterium]